MISAPPSEVGAVQVTVAWVFPAVAEMPLGIPATLEGRIPFDGPTPGPNPIAFFA